MNTTATTAAVCPRAGGSGFGSPRQTQRAVAGTKGSPIAVGVGTRIA